VSSEVRNTEKSAQFEDKIKKLDDLIRRLENLFEKLEKSEIPSKEEFSRRLSDIIDELEDVVYSLEDFATGLSKSSDVEELREVGRFIRVLGDVARDVLGSAISKFSEIIDGRRLGENVAALYTSLKNAGLPDHLVQEIVKEYTTRTLSSIPNLADLVSKFLTVAEMKKEESSRERR